MYLNIFVAVLALVLFAYVTRLVIQAVFPSTYILKKSRQVARETWENDLDERRQETEKQRSILQPPTHHSPEIAHREEVQYPTRSLEVDDSSEHQPAREIPSSSIRTCSSSTTKSGGNVSQALKRIKKGAKLISSTSHKKRVELDNSE